MVSAEFILVSTEMKNPILIQQCMIENLIFNNDIITIKKENFDYEFEIISMYNVIDNGVHMIKYDVIPLYGDQTKEIIRKLRIIDIDTDSK